jgi:DNA end-binding protein Ku
MLQPWDKGLVGTTLRYPYEVRDAKDYFDEIPEMKLPKDMLQLAEHILETKAGDFEPGKFEDRYENAVVEMLQRKRAGMPVPTERIAAPAPNVVSLMDASKRSLAAEEEKAPEPAAKSKKPKKRAAGQREMPLPIAGKGTAKETAKRRRRSLADLRPASGRPANAYAPRSLLPQKGRGVPIARRGGKARRSRRDIAEACGAMGKVSDGA